jgi:hypothetical protein
MEISSKHLLRTGNRISRTVSVADREWVKVTTRFQPADGGELHSFYDRFRFVSRPDWSYSFSVGGFNPDARYKASVANFLLELYKRDRKPRYLNAARKALAFLNREIVPERKWYDRRETGDDRTAQSRGTL